MAKPVRLSKVKRRKSVSEEGTANAAESDASPAAAPAVSSAASGESAPVLGNLSPEHTASTTSNAASEEGASTTNDVASVETASTTSNAASEEGASATRKARNLLEETKTKTYRDLARRPIHEDELRKVGLPESDIDELKAYREEFLNANKLKQLSSSRNGEGKLFRKVEPKKVGPVTTEKRVHRPRQWPEQERFIQWMRNLSDERIAHILASEAPKKLKEKFTRQNVKRWRDGSVPNCSARKVISRVLRCDEQKRSRTPKPVAVARQELGADVARLGADVARLVEAAQENPEHYLPLKRVLEGLYEAITRKQLR